MRTFDYPFEALFKKGLRSDIYAPQNGNSCDYIRHVKPTDRGLVGIKNILHIDSATEYQVFALQSGVYVLSSTTLYSVNTTTHALTSLLSGITPGPTPWSVADFGKYALFCNGSTYIVYDGTSYTLTPAALHTAGTICAFKGRVITGNLTNYPVTGANTNWIAWSEIGNLQFLASATASSMYKNTSGFAPMMIRGSVLRIVPIGDHCIIYTTNAIYALYNATVGDTNTLGIKQISNIGLKYAKAVIEDNYINPTTQWFIGTDNQLYQLDNSLKITLLKYLDYMSPSAGAVDSLVWCGDNTQILALSSPILSYDKMMNELYISSITAGITYILNQQGMGMIEGVIYGIIPDATNSMYKVGRAVLSTAQANIDIVSDIIDFGYAGLKSIEYIDFGILCPNTVSIAIEYRDTKASAYAISTCKIINNEGFVKLGIRGIDFRIRISVAAFTSFVLSNMKIGIQTIDKRYKRGILIK